MSGNDNRPALRVLESDASGWCEPDSDVCAVPGAASPVGADDATGEPGGINAEARAEADPDRD